MSAPSAIRVAEKLLEERVIHKGTGFAIMQDPRRINVNNARGGPFYDRGKAGEAGCRAIDGRIVHREVWKLALGEKSRMQSVCTQGHANHANDKSGYEL
jgi:hypothetical protein